MIKLLLLQTIFNVYTLLPNPSSKPFAQEGSLTTDSIIPQGGSASFSYAVSTNLSWPSLRKHLVEGVVVKYFHNANDLFSIYRLRVRILGSSSSSIAVLAITSSTFTDCLSYLSLPLAQDGPWSSFFDRPAPKQCQNSTAVLPTQERSLRWTFRTTPVSIGCEDYLRLRIVDDLSSLAHKVQCRPFSFAEKTPPTRQDQQRNRYT